MLPPLIDTEQKMPSIQITADKDSKPGLSNDSKPRLLYDDGYYRSSYRSSNSETNVGLIVGLAVEVPMVVVFLIIIVICACCCRSPQPATYYNPRYDGNPANNAYFGGYDSTEGNPYYCGGGW